MLMSKSSTNRRRNSTLNQLNFITFSKVRRLTLNCDIIANETIHDYRLTSASTPRGHSALPRGVDHNQIRMQTATSTHCENSFLYSSWGKIYLRQTNTIGWNSTFTPYKKKKKGQESEPRSEDIGIPVSLGLRRTEDQRGFPRGRYQCTVIQVVVYDQILI